MKSIEEYQQEFYEVAREQMKNEKLIEEVAIYGSMITAPILRATAIAAKSPIKTMEEFVEFETTMPLYVLAKQEYMELISKVAYALKITELMLAESTIRLISRDLDE